MGIGIQMQEAVSPVRLMAECDYDGIVHMMPSCGLPTYHYVWRYVDNRDGEDAFLALALHLEDMGFKVELTNEPYQGKTMLIAWKTVQSTSTLLVEAKIHAWMGIDSLETYPCVDRRDCIPDIREIVRF